MIRSRSNSFILLTQQILFAGIIVLSCLGLPTLLEAVEERRPNLLILIADDWGNQGASFPGAAGVKTPAFDRIAREGMLFRNAHSAAPSCSPSRAALLTGQWPWRLEQGANLHGFIPPKIVTYPDLLEPAGYFVGMEKKGYSPGSNEGRPHNAAGPSFKDFDSFLVARPKEKPFCYWFGSRQPHRPYASGTGVKSGIDPEKVFVPPYLPDNETTRHDICDYLEQIEQFDRQCAEVLLLLEKSGEIDNTLIVVTGDNGWPFPRAKATCYDSGTHQLLAVRWGARIKAGSVVEDQVSLSDLAPTFLEAAGVTVPASMTGRSLMPMLMSGKSGQIDPSRDHILTGMERHVQNGRSDGDNRSVGYPMRTLITKDFHYIRNFKPDRWPAGDPCGLPAPGFEVLATSTTATYPDCDAGPTKAFMVAHADDPAVKPFKDRSFGKRPPRELYDLRLDPFELRNLAEDPHYTETVEKLDATLMAELKASGDPRATGSGVDLDTLQPSKPKAAPKP